MKNTFLTFLLLSFLYQISFGISATKITFNETEESQTYVVIISIADYKYGTAQQGDLRYTTNDALKFYELMTSPTGWKLPKSNVTLLQDKQATKVNILQTLQSVFDKASDKDKVFFYYTGHGEAGNILPYDAHPKTNTFLNYEDIKAIFKDCKADTKFAIIDACFANSIKESKRSNSKNKKSVSTEQIIVMSAAQSYQTAAEHGTLKQGVFSYFLITGLKGKADKNKDKVITIAELHQFVYQNVKAYTKNKQVPHTFGNFDTTLPIFTME